MLTNGWGHEHIANPAHLLDLFKLMFFTFYQGKSPFFTTIWKNVFSFFQAFVHPNSRCFMRFTHISTYFIRPLDDEYIDLSAEAPSDLG